MPRGRRDVAQLGSALDWGSRGRRFKSCRPDSVMSQDIGNCRTCNRRSGSVHFWGFRVSPSEPGLVAAVVAGAVVDVVTEGAAKRGEAPTAGGSGRGFVADRNADRGTPSAGSRLRQPGGPRKSARPCRHPAPPLGQPHSMYGARTVGAGGHFRCCGCEAPRLPHQGCCEGDCA